MFADPKIQFIEKYYLKLIAIGSSLQSLFLLLMRLTWGHQFLLAGWTKFQNLEGVIVFFAKIGIPFPTFHAILVALFEFLGGLCLLLGFASRLAAIPLIFIMFVAYGAAHSHPFTHFAFLKDPSLLVREAPFPFLLTALIVFIFGPGRLSIDAWLKKKSKFWPQL
jgi:putative oxidoreductase